MNVRALRSRAPSDPVLSRYDEIARLLTGRESASADHAIAWLRELADDLKILPLSSFGIGEHDIDSLVAEAQRASSMKGNPIVLTREELAEVLASAI
jgi:alcohol dehydrogenase class IV